MTIKNLNHAEFDNKTVLVRVDFNVPMEGKKITDATRILQSLPTIQELRDKGAKVVLMSHMGRPGGQKHSSLSLRPVAAELHNHLGDVYFSDEVIGQVPTALVESLKPGEVALLENLRFHIGEEKNDETFAAKLALLGDLYVNDAFSASHRAHASVCAITEHLPSYAGRVMEKEVATLEDTLNRPKTPLMAIVGGAKISTKIGLLKSFAHRVDTLAVVGGMANTFLYAMGFEVGTSLCEESQVEEAMGILQELSKRSCKIILPIDAVVAVGPRAGVKSIIVDHTDVPEDQMILDVGPQTIDHIKEAINESQTLIWNGALGVTEVAPFEYGTTVVARHVASQTKAGRLISVAGGGDTVAALNQASCFDDLTYVSMAGGAFLEWVQGYPLPGIEALRESVVQIFQNENLFLQNPCKPSQHSHSTELV